MRNIEDQEKLDMVFGKKVKKIPEKTMMENYTEYLISLHNFSKKLNREQRKELNQIVSLLEINEVHTAINAFNACLHFVQKDDEEQKDADFKNKNSSCTARGIFNIINIRVCFHPPREFRSSFWNRADIPSSCGSSREMPSAPH